MSQSRQPTRVILLGSTGSIGTQTVEVIEHLRRHGEPFEVVGLCAGGSNLGLLAEQAVRLGVPGHKVAIGRAPAGGGGGSTELPAELRGAVCGAGAAEALVRETPCDVVVAAMVGASGLGATLAAVELGRRVALANKETLVAAGGIIVPAAERTGAVLLPVDSEHSAVWQCLQGRHGSAAARAGSAGACVPPMRCDGEVRRVILTASGGALRHLSAEAARRATPAEALKHPTWSMGAKVTIDSASLTNKAFELIEAHHLFGLEPERLAVVIHPQSLVHSMVEFADGSVMAQISPPDMRLPIQYALTFPARVEGIARRVDWLGLGGANNPMARMEFSVPEAGRYPALAAAERVMRVGGTSGAIFNGASEVAVEAFLAAGGVGGSGGSGAMRFGEMADVACAALEGVRAGPASTLADVLAADRAAREWAREWLARAGFGEQVGVSSRAAR